MTHDDHTESQEKAGSAFSLEGPDEQAGSGSSAAQGAKKRLSNKANAAIVAAVVGVPLLIFGVQQNPDWLPIGNDQNQEQAQTPPEDSTTFEGEVITRNDNAPTENPRAGEFWVNDKGQIRYPIEIEDWQREPGVVADASVQKKLVAKYSGSEVASASGVLPSAEAGYTSDPKKKLLADGTLNPVYTSVTQEDFSNSAFQYIERAINPMFGDWMDYSEDTDYVSQNFESYRYEDMFTPAYLKKNQGKNPSTWVPIFADWKENNYGMGDKLITGGPRWIGEMKSSKTTFSYNKADGSYTANVTANIKFSAWQKDQSVASKNGVLKLKLVPNPDETADANHKFLIDDASLTTS